MLAVADWYVPTAQLAQLVEPAEPWKVPAAQLRHSALPADG